MRDEFALDIGDFGKYGLLRWLCGVTSDGRRIRLGVIWYYVATDVPLREPGDTFKYLSTPGTREQPLEQCDPELYDILRRLIDGGGRSVEAVEQSEILPDDTVFYRDAVNAPLARDGWFTRAMHAVEDCDLVFLDADNGLSDTPDVEHATYGEAAALYGKGKSLVIFQSFGRTGAEREIQQHAERLRQELGIDGPPGEIVALRYHRRIARVFFVIPNPANPGVAQLLRERVASFMESCWGDHFTRVDC